MAYAHQMVDMLTEENRMLRQEMEVCRDKVTKLHKVTPADVRAGFQFSLSRLERLAVGVRTLWSSGT